MRFVDEVGLVHPYKTVVGKNVFIVFDRVSCEQRGFISKKEFSITAFTLQPDDIFRLMEEGAL